MKNTVAVATLGCKVNQYESAVIRESFQKRGYQLVSFGDKAQVYIINTCTITKKTDYQSRQLIRRAKKLNPSSTIVVTGCYAQVFPEEIERITGVHYILGNSHKDKIVDLVGGSLGKGYPHILVSPVGQEDIFMDSAIDGLSSPTRPPIKIQDGCNASCSYCIIPLARGSSRSKKPEAVIEEISHLARLGFKEVILSGIHLGAYGLDLQPKTTLLNLIQQLEKKRVINRIRLSSIEPTELNKEVIDCISSSEMICPHLHIPLQSGDDGILKTMNRMYCVSFFEELIQNLVEKIQGLSIGLDVIVGFPGEGVKEFENTLTLLKRLSVSYLHVFPYSPRPNTVAAKLPDQVHGKIAKERSKILRELGRRKREEFYRKYLNRELNILVESGRNPETSLLKGFSKNYIPVLIKGEDTLKNCELKVIVKEVEGEKVLGRLCRS